MVCMKKYILFFLRTSHVSNTGILSSSSMLFEYVQAYCSKWDAMPVILQRKCNLE